MLSACIGPRAGRNAKVRLPLVIRNAQGHGSTKRAWVDKMRMAGTCPAITNPRCRRSRRGLEPIIQADLSDQHFVRVAKVISLVAGVVSAEVDKERLGFHRPVPIKP